MNQKIQHSEVFKLFSYILAILLVVILTGGNVWGNVKKNKTRIKVEYLKKGDNTKQITATVSSRINRKPVPVKMAMLHFYDETDSTQLIGTVKTDMKGVAILTLPSDYPIGKDDEGSSFVIRFDGNDEFKPASKEINIKDVNMEVTYKVIDSTYTVNVSATEMVNGKPGNPVSDVDVYVYVQRLFSLLKVGEGWLQDGKATVEIPKDIPGNKEGNLEFVTMIPDADDYGTIETNNTVQWGVPLKRTNKYADESKRALWEPRAPLWMVITLSILLAGVFYHYFLIAYKLCKIKKLGKQESA